VPGGIPGGQLGGVIGGIIGSISSLAAAPALSKPVPAVQRVRISPGCNQRTAHLIGLSPFIRPWHCKPAFKAL